MADYKDDYYAEVDNAFADLRQHPFAEQDLLQPTPQERGVPLAPAGWVENADGADGEAKVIINADGLTVLDGKIFIRDSGGASVLGAAGFAGSWVDFLANGTYNGSFGSGTEESIIANTIVGTASTEEDYEASLSEDLPYWIIDDIDVSGGGSLMRVTDPDASGGYALQWTGDVVGAIIQDVPVVPGYQYVLSIVFHDDALAGSAFEYQLTSTVSFRDGDHALIEGTQADVGEVFANPSETEYTNWTLSDPQTAPVKAKYMRVEVKITHNSGNPVVRIADVVVEKVSTRSAVYFTSDKVLEWTGADADGEGATFSMSPFSVGDLSWVFSDGEAINFGARSPGYLRTTGMVVMSGHISPAQLTGNQNNYNPTDGTKRFMWRMTSDAARTITGIVPVMPGASTGSFWNGETHFITNAGSQNIILAHQSASSTDRNRIVCPGAVNLTLTPGMGCLIIYDGVSERWRVIA